MRLEDLLGQLVGVRPRGTGKWSARCPGHEDCSPSLSICEGGDDGRILLHCFAGCSVRAICDALGIRVADLFQDHGVGPAQILDAQRRRAAERRRRETVAHSRGLAIDALREAEALIQSATGLNISTWSNERLDREMNRLADAYDLLWAERSADGF